MIDKVLSFISITAKAGNLVSGEFAVQKAIKEGKACLVIVSEDASGNTKKKCSDMCCYRDIPLVVYGTKETLGKACGKDYRSSVAICDQGCSDNIKRLLVEVKI